MDNQPQEPALSLPKGALGPLPSAPKPPMPPAPAPMQMQKPITPPAPIQQPKVMPSKMPVGEKPKQTGGGMKPMMIVQVALAILMAVGFLVLYVRIDAVQSKIKTLGDKTTEVLGDVQGKVTQLVEADKKREDLVAEMKKKIAEAGAMMNEKGAMMKSDGELLKQEGGALKSSEAAKTDESMMKKGETMMTEGDTMMKNGDAMMMEGQKMQTDAGTATP